MDVRAVALSLSLLALAGCAPTVEYVGERHAPSQSVVVYYSRRDVPAGYRVMGRAIAHAPSGVSGTRLRHAIEDKARDVGADAVVLGGYRRVKSGEYLQWTYEDFDGPWLDPWDWEFGPHWGPRVTSFGPDWGNARVVYDYSLELKALFLKRSMSNATAAPQDEETTPQETTPPTTE